MRLEPSDDEIEGIVDAVRRVGGLEYARGKAEEFAQDANSALDKIPVADKAMDALRESIRYAIERKR